MDNKKQGRINWVTILRGITICLVVARHVQLQNAATGENYAFIDEINAWFTPLRMPIFVMVSGMLLYHTRIGKQWATAALYKDKLVRIGLPLVFCTCLGTAMQLAFNSFVKTPHDVTLLSFLQSFVVFDGMPWPHRWYLLALLTMMAMYPLYVRLSRRWQWALLLAILIGMQRMDFAQYVETNWGYLFSLNKYLPFFCIGIASARYDWWRWIGMHPKAVLAVTVALYVALYHDGVICPLDEYLPMVEIYGMVMMVALCMCLDGLWPSVCSSFRSYIFQIYLFGIAFQAFVELILWRGLGRPDDYVLLFYAMNILAGIYLPVLMCKVVERIPNRWIRHCFGF